ncbi:MAG: hypothetical protein MI919_10555 [Holophagales bacterium]|nr:hypothetical protein [Holophagales bacterium]
MNPEDSRPSDRALEDHLARRAPRPGGRALATPVLLTVLLAGIAPAASASAGASVGASVGASFGATSAAGPEPAAGPKALEATQRLLLPFYSVDKTNPSGDSTLFAVRNEGLSQITVTASFYEIDSPQAPQRTEIYLLQAKQIRTVQIRDVPNLEVDPDGFARGYVIFETGGVDQLIHGDYFQVTPGERFATGGRLVDVSGGPFDELCNNVSVRFLDGGGFTGGTQIVYWLNATSVPLPINTITYSIYEEAGVAPVFTSNLPISTVAGEVDIDQLLGGSGVSFGAVEIQFAGELEGHVFSTMSASNEFSVRVEATCR